MRAKIWMLVFPFAGGLERLIIVGPGRGIDPTELKQTEMRFFQEVLPAL